MPGVSVGVGLSPRVGLARGVGVAPSTGVENAAGLVAFGSAFAGTNENLDRGGDLTGIVDGQAGLLSFWALRSNTVNEFDIMLESEGFRVSVYFDNGGGIFTVIMRNAANADVLNMVTTAGFQSETTWSHFLAAWDLSVAGRRHIFVNDVEDTNETTFSDDTIDYVRDSPEWTIGARSGPSLQFLGDLANYYFTNEWLDITQVANRRKFISSSGKPVALGSQARKPTGTPALLYLDNPFDSFEINKGTGGNMIENGTLTASPTSPSD